MALLLPDDRRQRHRRAGDRGKQPELVGQAAPLTNGTSVALRRGSGEAVGYRRRQDRCAGDRTLRGTKEVSPRGHLGVPLPESVLATGRAQEAVDSVVVLVVG